MDEDIENYYCINCGKPVKDLYKKYSASVLKLTECDYCNNIADKYLEYDIVIIVIDLILLRVMAYRHILLNSKFKNFWKLSIILVLLEAYINWSATTKNIHSNSKVNESIPYLTDSDIYFEDIGFYMLCIDMVICTICFVGIIYFFTLAYTFVKRQTRISFLRIYKLVTVSSAGIFLFLPSLIWDLKILNYHQHFISIYTTLSHLLAYKALCGCEKVWALLIVMSSSLIKMYLKNYINTMDIVRDLIPD